MEDQENTTELHGETIIVDTNEDAPASDHDANIGELWLTLDEVQEIYTEVTEEQTPRRDSYMLDDLASIDFYRNYDGSYTLAEHGPTLEVDEWKDICEWIMEQHGGSEQEPEYVNDLHEKLETNEIIVSWDTGYEHIHMELENNEVDFVHFRDLDVSLRQVGGVAYEGDVFVSIDGPAVDEILRDA